MVWLFSSWQLLGWILFNPAAWRNYLKSIDSSLEPDCTLWDLWGHWRKPQAQALRLSYILLPVMMAILVWGIRLSLDDTRLYNAAVEENVKIACETFRDENTRKRIFEKQEVENFVRNFAEICRYPEKSPTIDYIWKEDHKTYGLWRAISYSWVFSCIGALLGGFLSTVAFGLITANVAALLMGIAMNIPWPFLNLIGILIGFAAATTGTSTVSTMSGEISLKKKISYFSAILMIISVVAILIFHLMQGDYTSLLLLVFVFMYVYGIRNGLAILFIFLSILIVLQHDIFEISSFNAVAHFIPDKNYSALSGVIDALFLILIIFTMYGISYGIGKRLLDTWSASIIGAIPAMMIFILHHYRVVNVEILQTILAGNLQENYLSDEWKTSYEIFWNYYPLFILFVVLLSYHNYILRYLIESTIGTLLYHADKRRYENPNFLPKNHHLLWHPAFHDKTQVLPFYELEDYLILVGRHHQEIQTYLLQLNETPQANVAKNVLFFLEIINLVQLDTVDKIAKSSISTTISDDRLEILGEISEELSFILDYSNSGYVVRALEKIQKRLARLEKYALSQQDDKLRNYTLQVVKQWKSVIENDKNIRKWLARRRITNPYIPSRPLHTEDQELFKGRQKVRDAIATFIESQEATLTLYGKKEIGKTSILLNLQQLMGKSDIRAFFYIDFQRGGLNTDDNIFWKNIIEEVNLSLRMSRKWKNKPELLSIPQDDFQVWFNQLMEQLHTYGVKKVILCFDELGVLLRNFETGSLDENVLETFRAISQRFVRFPEVKFIFAYPSAIFDIPLSYRLFNTRMHLSYQFDNEQEARELIEHPISGFELTYEPTVVDKILQLTGKHPRLIQRICHELVEYKNAQDQYQATLADLDNILPKAKQGVEGLFHGYFSYLKTEEQTLFRFIAAHRTGVDIEQLSQQWLNLTQLNQLLARLIELEFIVERASQSNDCIYQVTIELFGEWVQT